jgi:hypothetical protein
MLTVALASASFQETLFRSAAEALHAAPAAVSGATGTAEPAVVPAAAKAEPAAESWAFAAAKAVMAGQDGIEVNFAWAL